MVRDRFGHALRAGLDLPRPVTCGPAEVTPELVAGADQVVCVHAGHDSGLRDALDAVAYAQGVPSVGVELLPARIVCGPVTIPGRTACYACFEKRLRQHRAGDDGYDLDAATRDLPEGFGPQHVAIARSFLAQALEEIRTGPSGLGGTVRAFDLVSGVPSSAGTLSVNGCRRCGGRFRERSDGSTVALSSLP